MTDQLIYDWNVQGAPQLRLPETVGCLDETLAEGLRATSVVQPDLPACKALIALARRVGFSSVNLGLADSRGVLERWDGGPAAVSVRSAAGLQSVLGSGIEEIRIHAPVSDLLLGGRRLSAAVDDLCRMIAQVGSRAVWVAEDATRTPPATLSTALRAVHEAGARRVCLVDSAGTAMPLGVMRLLSWARQEAPDMRWDWGGRNDRGLATVNALAALSTGADRVCGTALGLGEGPGVVALDTLLTNVALMRSPTVDLKILRDWCVAAAGHLGVSIPVNYPVLGEDAFRTATGVHAAAIVKARKKGDVGLADRVYSGIPAGWFGLAQRIDIGPMSGLSNVSCWLEERSLHYTSEDVTRILQCAKQSNRTLSEEEVLQVLKESPPTPATRSETPA
ncbi:MAG TPA: 2-isopropylmalate synthase [Candidatus Xenobia bacterium]|jgi:2-isopropylmalate synthase